MLKGEIPMGQINDGPEIYRQYVNCGNSSLNNIGFFLVSWVIQNICRDFFSTFERVGSDNHVESCL